MSYGCVMVVILSGDEGRAELSSRRKRTGKRTRKPAPLKKVYAARVDASAGVFTIGAVAGVPLSGSGLSAPEARVLGIDSLNRATAARPTWHRRLRECSVVHIRFPHRRCAHYAAAVTKGEKI